MDKVLSENIGDMYTGVALNTKLPLLLYTPSVEYGNLTSGAVIIKTKSGVTPFETKVKLDSYSKMFYAGKGFLLGEKAGAMNLSADYSQSYDDIRMIQVSQVKKV